MNNMTDILEQYIKELFQEASENQITIKRSNVAQKFDCVPSQLNYVIKTRFTPEHGFFIESKRGGGGFIKITRITLHQEKDYIDYLIDNITGDTLEVEDALKIIKILKDKEYIGNFEYKHIVDSIETVCNVHNNAVDLLDNDDNKQLLEIKTKEQVKDLTIKFLTNIKYK